MSKELGHDFLARLGKTKLRPGGKEATEWLLDNANITKDSNVLEVACNMGTTMISVARKYGCHIIGVDLMEDNVVKAKNNIKENKLQDLIKVEQGNALKLNFKDNVFDVVINEAMLTMFSNESKQQALKEYYRVLKPGGVLLTHDVCLNTEDKDKQEELIKALRINLNMNVLPLTLCDWYDLLSSNGFTVTQKSGPMSLMNPIGMLKDEGLFKTVKIIKNAHKKENKEMFQKMFKLFNNNSKELYYVANISKK